MGIVKISMTTYFELKLLRINGFPLVRLATGMGTRKWSRGHALFNNL